jgi:hypothetical protein
VNITTREGISVALVRQPSTQSAGVVTVSLPKETATAGNGFSFPVPEQVVSTTGGESVLSVTVGSGAPLPAWLRYVPESKSFIATAVPDGAFPIEVVVKTTDHSTTVLISERRNQ